MHSQRYRSRNLFNDKKAVSDAEKNIDNKRRIIKPAAYKSAEGGSEESIYYITYPFFHKIKK
ncbi:hypothetical protein TPHV1_140041 [Treponema phagedenis]|uniref:Uncharacterized protein n=1 Tax=Treponema phagedenis TaxID=162 RepID=A0A0B7GRN4_TREPH|nr:hypothetical protein TPHV1_140041 [Treponema phagedenis]